MHEEELYSRQEGAPSRPRTRRVLTVRMLAAKTAWLEGTLRWRDGGVAWETGEAALLPTARDLSEAQRALHQLRRYPISATLALGDVEGWLERRQQRLELAKHLARLPGSGLEALTQQARAGKGPAIDALVSLLAAEALCANRLPISPAAALAGCREAAEAPLAGSLRLCVLPPPARALSALTLGAVHAALPERPRPDFSDVPDRAWLERAYRHGRQSGLPAEPVLVTALLADENGASLTRRWAAATAPDQPFALDAELLRELLATGAAPRRVISMAEAVAEARMIAERLLDHRALLPERWERDRHQLAKEYDEQAAQSIELFRVVYEKYARAGVEPDAIRGATELTLLLLGRPDQREPVVPALVELLEQSLSLPAPLLREWFGTLLAHSELFWPTRLPPELCTQLSLLQVSGATRARALPALQMARVTGDIEIPVEALQLGLMRELGHLGQLRDPESYRYLLRLAREFPTMERAVYPLGALLEKETDPAAARRALLPLLNGIRSFPADVAGWILDAVFPSLPGSSRQRWEAIPRMTRCLDALRLHLPKPTARLVMELVSAMVLLVTRLPDCGVERFERLVLLTRRLAEADPKWIGCPYDLALAVELGLALAPEEDQEFMAIVQTALRHPPREWRYSLEAGLRSLEQSPELRAILARAFHRQPHRCTALVSRLSAAARLEGGPLQGVTGVEDSPDLSLAEAGWAELLQLAPELLETARAYVAAQRVLGGPSSPPQSVLKALGLKARLEAELRYLQARIDGGSASPAMTARAGNLRARLEDETGLARTIAGEAREHLADASADAGLAAAERRLQERFFQRLDEFAGPLPEGLQLTDDWLNAALLSATIEKNRKLLRRLLRECLAGNPRAMEAYPENVRYLRSLAERGVNVEAWLGAHPRRYRCAVPGGWVRVYLERDPLRILQMGNYFDTCLSFDGCNSFSTVANAAELNKRVLYAEDSAGRVIGRKLIGIEAEGKLVGFRTYSSLSESEGSGALHAVICHYALRFAERCGLETADQGTVPRLFAGGWYDDGTEPWTYEGPESRALQQDKGGEPIFDQA